MSLTVLQSTFVDGYEGFFFADASMDVLLTPPRGSWSAWWRDMSGELRPWSSAEDGSVMAATAPVTDYPGLLAFREEVRAHADRVLGGFGEFLPLISSEGPLWAFHCTNVVDALDLERCEGVVWKNREDGSRTILLSDHLEFDAGAVEQGGVFMIPQQPKGSMYFAPQVAAALLDPPGLITGLGFRPPY